ncbi:MAG: hypothetical protein Q4D41_11930 [Prevotellaceae bacterium]|nr:hypothetical protein [Prevotellaceae bacterium]
MATFVIYTYMFSPITEAKEADLFSNSEPISLNDAYANRHEMLEEYFSRNGQSFTFTNDDKEYGVKTLLNKDGVIVLRLSNKNKSREREYDFEVLDEPDQPSCLVIIDNRKEGRQSVSIEIYRKAFHKTARAARLLESNINAFLRRKRMKVSVNAKYSREKFWDVISRYRKGIAEVAFHFPYPNMPEITERVDRLFGNIAKQTNSEPVLKLPGQNGEPLTLTRDMEFIMQAIDACAASGKPIKVKPVGEKRFIQVNKESPIYEELSDNVLKDLNNDDMFMSKFYEIKRYLDNIRIFYDKQ